MSTPAAASTLRIALPPAGAASSGSAKDRPHREEHAALLCCHEPSYQEYIANQLGLMGLKVYGSATHEESISKLASRPYHLTVLLENLEGCALADNLVLQHLAQLATDERRGTYVLLLCQSFATGDEMNAYALGVDRLVNYADISQLAEIVGPALEEHEEGNRHFNAARLQALSAR